MKGSIQTHSGGKYRFIAWYHQGRHEKFYDDFLHGGQKFWVTHKDPSKCFGYERALRCLTVIRGDWEAHQRGERSFDLNRYRGRFTDIIPYLETWLALKESSVSPGTLTSYRPAIHKHLIPFFQRHHMQLHEIQKDSMLLLIKELNLHPKTKKNVVGVLRSCLKDASESNRIPKLPAFPSEAAYGIEAKPKKWIDRATQEAILAEIPTEHQPIFRWMQLHWRRVGEAISLYREDHDKKYDVFLIHRGVSNKKVVNKTKTGDVIVMPCHPDFKKYLTTPRILSPFLFTNASSRSFGKRYTHKALMTIWLAACAKVGVEIDIHRGLRTSGASQAVNELHWSIEETQKYGAWKDKKTVENHYSDYELGRIRELQSRIVQLVPKAYQDKG